MYSDGALIKNRSRGTYIIGVLVIGKRALLGIDALIKNSTFSRGHCWKGGDY